MCGRFTNRLTWDEIVRLYRLTMKASPHNLPPRYNICPTDPVDVVTESEGSRDFVRMRWGLAPSWWPKPLKELKAATFNAHGETVAESSGLGHFEHLRGAPVYLHRANSAFFRTAASVCPRPSFSSQSATCCIEGAPWIMGFIRPHRPDYQTNPQRSRRLRALADYGASLSVWLGHQPARRPPRPDGRAGRPARAAHVRRNAASALFGCSGGLRVPCPVRYKALEGWDKRGPRVSCRVLSSMPVLGRRGLWLSHVSVSCSEPARSATCRLGRQPSQPALRRPAIATHPHAEVLTRLYIAAHCAAGVMTFGARLSRSTAAFEPQHNAESAASAQGAECHPCSTLQFGWGKPPSLLDLFRLAHHFQFEDRPEVRQLALDPVQ
jgi:SOS response associated peptidase (SRAP)